MKCLVTGGAGFIGSHLVDALYMNRHQVMVLDDFSTGRKENLEHITTVNPRFPLIRADISKASTADLIAAATPDVVFHLAGQVDARASMHDAYHDRLVNVTGTANVLSGALMGGAERFVFVSSGGAIYGPTAGADEDTVPNPKTYYGAHKLLAEHYIKLSLANSGISYVILRPSNVYGPRQRSGVVSIFDRAIREDEEITLYGDGTQARDFVHVDDMVDAIMRVGFSNSRHLGPGINLGRAAAFPEGHGRIYNVSSGQATGVNQLIRHLEQKHGQEARIERKPAQPGDIQVSRLVSTRISRELGWSPTIPLDIAF